MKLGKATGEDGIPTEIYIHSPLARESLFELTKMIFKEEEVPDDFVNGIFCPIYKNKGSRDDMSKYRFICLLNHSYKLVSSVLLSRLKKEIEQSLPDNQFGFRAKRSTEDPIALIRHFIDYTISNDMVAHICYVDYSAAFDTVSHHFLDECLERYGASPSSRAVFRAIYNSAYGKVRAKAKDGKVSLSDIFPIVRGVVQGDIFSPYCFIIALAKLFEECEIELSITKMFEQSTRANEEDSIVEATVAPETIDEFEFDGDGIFPCGEDAYLYADDAALVDPDHEMLNKRTNILNKNSSSRADMNINVSKTYSQTIAKAVKIDHSKEEEYRSFEFSKYCKNCGDGFPCNHGLKVHLTFKLQKYLQK